MGIVRLGRLADASTQPGRTHHGSREPRTDTDVHRTGRRMGGGTACGERSARRYGPRRLPGRAHPPERGYVLVRSWGHRRARGCSGPPGKRARPHPRRPSRGCRTRAAGHPGRGRRGVPARRRPGAGIHRTVRRRGVVSPVPGPPRRSRPGGEDGRRTSSAAGGDRLRRSPGDRGEAGDGRPRGPRGEPAPVHTAAPRRGPLREGRAGAAAGRAAPRRALAPPGRRHLARRRDAFDAGRGTAAGVRRGRSGARRDRGGDWPGWYGSPS